MEELIKEIEALKRNGMLWTDYNNALADAINILQSKIVIKAKALRKRGTNLWYYGSETLVMEVDDLLPYYNEIPTILPEDAELIDIEIIVK
jgi:hypothetical protein